MRTSKMRREIELKKGWVFTGRDGKRSKWIYRIPGMQWTDRMEEMTIIEEPVTTALHLQPRILTARPREYIWSFRE